MIIGIGADIVEIKRIENAINKNNKFLHRLFTPNELELFKCKSYKAESIAGRFSGKEAVAKAVGTGFRKFSMKDIEILSDNLGKPIVNVYGNVRAFLNEYRNWKIHISISHSKENAIAYVVMEGEI